MSTTANQRLQDRRTAQGLTLRELAHFAGCSHTTIARLEAGDLDVAPALKARIARALRVPVAVLWPQGDGEPLGKRLASQLTPMRAAEMIKASAPRSQHPYALLADHLERLASKPLQPRRAELRLLARRLRAFAAVAR